MGTPALFLLGAGSIAEADVGYEDFGESYGARIRPNPIRPAGIGGEAIFSAVYLALTFSAAFRIRVTPILDGIPLWDLSFDVASEIGLESRDPPHTFENPLRQRFYRNDKPVFSHALRGSSFTVEISMPCPGVTDGDLIFEGIEVEYQVVSEAAGPS